MMAMFLVEDKHTYLRFDNTTPINIPNIVMRAPPNTGWGIVMNTAENFPINPNAIYIIANTKNTSRLPT